MGLVILYVTWAQDPYPVAIGATAIADEPTLASIVVVSIVALLLGAVSAAAIYYAEHWVQQLVRDYQQRCMRRVMKLACHQRIGRIIIEFERRTQSPLVLQDVLIAGSRFSAFALRSVTQLVLPVMTLLIAAAVLLWINWLITAILVALLVFYLVPLYFINRGVAKHHRNYRAVTPGVFGDIKRRLRSLLQTSGPIREARSLRDETLIQDETFRHMQDSLYGRILATNKIALVNGMFLSICVFLLLIIFSALIGADEASWAQLLAYVVALRFTWTSVRQLTAALTKLSQFFPEFERFADLVRSAERVERSSPPKDRPLSEPVCIQSRGDADAALQSQDGPLELQRGRPVLALYPDRIDRVALERLNIALWPNDGFPGGCIFHDGPEPIAGESVLTNALGEAPNHDAVEQLGELLHAWGVRDELESLPRGLNTTLTPGLIRALSPDAAYAVMAAYCVVEQPAVVFLTLAGLSKTQSEFQRRFLLSLARCHIFIVDAEALRIFRKSFQGVREHVDGVIIAPRAQELHCVSLKWLEENSADVERVLAPLRDERVPNEVDKSPDQDDLDM